MNKRSYDLDFFQVMSPELAYVFGFWIADGSMNEATKRVNFFSKEEELLKEILHIMKSDRNIDTIVDGKFSWKSVSFQGEELYNAFLTLGGIPKKSNDVRFPKIGREFFAEFLRGFFEGDGSVGLYNNGKNTKALKVTFTSGSFDLIWEIQEQLFVLGINTTLSKKFYYTKQKTISATYGLVVFNQQAVKIFNLIYSSEPLFYKRKYLIFQKAVDYIKSREKSKIDEEKLCKLFSTMPLNELKSHFPNVTLTALKVLAWSLNLQDYEINPSKYFSIKCTICGAERRVTKSNFERVIYCRKCQLSRNVLSTQKINKRIEQEKLSKSVEQKSKVKHYVVPIRTTGDTKGLSLTAELAKKFIPADIELRLLKQANATGRDIRYLDETVENYKIEEINRDECLGFIQRIHYLKNKPLAPLFYFGLLRDGRLIGACTFSLPSRQTINVPGARKILELSRFATLDNTATNAESFFLASCLRLIKKKKEYDAIVTYADTTQGHIGTLYKATNFVLIGETAINYHYIRDNIRFHKKRIWDKAQELGVTESIYAETNGFSKILEDKKKKFAYYFNKIS